LTDGLTMVTRNDRDVAGLGATVLNPFRGAEVRSLWRDGPELVSNGGRESERRRIGCANIWT
jgi:hypothetical protein